jgi:hypothetical protein
MKKNEFKYGKPASPIAVQPKKRLPQYDECLKEFLKSGYSTWEVNMDSLPSKKSRVILSSLKWRTKHNPEFKGVRAFMYKSKVYLEKVTIGKSS